MKNSVHACRTPPTEGNTEQLWNQTARALSRQFCSTNQSQCALSRQFSSTNKPECALSRQFSSVLYLLSMRSENQRMRSTPSLRSFPDVAFETRLQTVSMSLHQSLNIVVHSDSGNALVRTTPTWKGVWAPEQTLIMDDLPNFSCHWADFVCVCVCVCVFLSLCRFGLHGVVRCSIQVCMRVSASLIQTPLCLVNTLPS